MPEFMNVRADRRLSSLLFPFLSLLLALLLMSPAIAAIQELPHDDTLERHRVVVDGHPMAVWSKSPETPRAVMLLIHGRTWSTRPDFDLQVPGEDLSLMDGLVDQGIAAYGLDLRGYGETGRDSTGWLTPDRAAEDVRQILGWLSRRHPDLSPPWLFGWSYGATVSQLVGQRNSTAMSGLILFGYPLRPGYDQDPENDQPLRAPTTAAAAAADFLLPGSISEAAIDAFVVSALKHDPVRMDWRGLDQWQALDGREVSVPVLLLQAAHDPLARPEVHAELFSALDTVDKSWTVIPGGDHAAFMETPRTYFLTLIESFVFRGESHNEE